VGAAVCCTFIVPVLCVVGGWSANVGVGLCMGLGDPVVSMGPVSMLQPHASTAVASRSQCTLLTHEDIGHVWAIDVELDQLSQSACICIEC
jgi:hypothetical protein